MKLICDYIEFDRRTKPVRESFDLDIVPDAGLGFFFPDRFEELVQYCIKNPKYHIISMLPAAIKLNKPVPNARYYLLDEGDSDPNLWYYDSMTKDDLESLEVYKFDLNERFT